MKLLQIIKIAFKNIISNKLRSILTMLGLVIGISSVIVLVGIGSGSSSEVKTQVQSLGTDILTLTISSSDYSLEYNKLEEIKTLTNIKEVTPFKNISATVNRGSVTVTRASMIGTDASYLQVTNTKLEKGRSISIIDIENKSKVCILGSDIASSLFSLADPLGESIKLNGDNYTVIGVLEEQGTSMGNNVDSNILIPITTAKYLGSDTSISNVYVKVEDEIKLERTILILENYIRSTLQASSDDYSVSSQDSMIDAMDSIDNTLSLLLGGIASISLIVGGIGVMNVMLVSVTESTKEIGIRKALGAKREDILMQFLVEALVISLLGGVLGILFGILIGNVANQFGYTFEYSNIVVLISFTSSAVIGILFGMFPAYRATKLNPIDALRVD